MGFEEEEKEACRAGNEIHGMVGCHAEAKGRLVNPAETATSANVVTLDKLNTPAILVLTVSPHNALLFLLRNSGMIFSRRLDPHASYRTHVMVSIVKKCETYVCVSCDIRMTSAIQDPRISVAFTVATKEKSSL